MHFPQNPYLNHCSGWTAFMCWKAIQYFAFSTCLTCGLNPYLPQISWSWSEERGFNLIYKVSRGLDACSLQAVHKCIFIFIQLSSPFYSRKAEEQRDAVILGAQFETPGPNLSGYLPLCNSSDIQSRAPIESYCSCECSALFQIRPWRLKSGICITGNMQLATMCAKFGVRTYWCCIRDMWHKQGGMHPVLQIGIL